MMQERVLLVAQSPVLRVGIQGVLEAAGGFQVVAEAQNGLEAAACAATHEPSIVIIQDALRGVSGVVVARAVRELCPHSRIVVLTDQVDDARIVAAVVQGADALLPAAVDAQGLITAIRQIATGRRPLAELVLSRPDLAARVFAEARAAGGAAVNAGTVRPSMLSAREIAILDGVVRGLSNREIAERLCLVEQTVKNHMTTLLRKLSAGDRTEAVVSAVRTGMIDLEAQLPAPPPAYDASSYSAA